MGCVFHGGLWEIAQGISIGVLHNELKVAVIHVELGKSSSKLGAEGGGGCVEGVDGDRGGQSFVDVVRFYPWELPGAAKDEEDS